MIGHWSPVDRGRFARTPQDSCGAKFWKGCIGLWAPCVWHGGDRLREWTAGGDACIGTLTNMAATCWVPSPLGWAIEFDGTNDYIDLPAAADSRLTPTKQITLLAVLSVAGSVTVREFITNAGTGGTPTGFGWGISDSASNQMKWYTGNGVSGHNIASGGTTFTSGVWYAVAATYFEAASGTNKYTYVDGKIDNSASTTATMSFASATAAIARYDAAASQYFPGRIALMGIWNYAMTPQSLKELSMDPVVLFRRKNRSAAKKATVAPPASGGPFPHYVRRMMRGGMFDLGL